MSGLGTSHNIKRLLAELPSESLSSSIAELTDAEPWLAEQDANPMWPTTFAPRWMTREGGSAMAFRRATALSDHPDEATLTLTLTRDMVGIGMNFAAQANPSAPIEETVVYSSATGMDDHDLRVRAC